MDKQKQIKKMSQDLCNAAMCDIEIYGNCNVKDGSCYRCTNVAKDLYNAGYRHQSEETFNQKLSVEQLKVLPQRAWVWIEILKPYSFGEKVSAYYRIDYDYTSGRALCCGYPGITFNFYYADYDKTWTAYQYQLKRSDSK